MSDDLVKRLRVCAAFDPDQAEAADRIEQDAQHIDEMYGLVAAMNVEHTASKTRIEKLEAALRDLCDGWECCAVSRSMRVVARKALDAK